MELRTCEKCRRLFYYLAGDCFCTDCRKDVDAAFRKADLYVTGRHDTSIAQVSTECDISVPQIETWVKEEKLHTIDEQKVYSVCEGCGKRIPTGNFCKLCKYKLMNGIKSALDVEGVQDTEQKPSKSRHAQMRFVNRDK